MTGLSLSVAVFRVQTLWLLLAWWTVAACAVQERPQQTAAAAPTGPLQLVYAELKGDKTSLWLAEAEDLTKRKIVATVGHAEGYGIRAHLSPDGQWLAYTALPPGGGEPSTDASLWIMKVNGSDQRLFLDGVDLRGTPVWSPDGAEIAVKRRPDPGSTAATEVVSVELSSGQKELILADALSAGLYLIGWGQKGLTFYYARYGPGGVDVMAANTATGEVRSLAYVTDGLVRDFSPSPDGTHILYTATRKEGAEPWYQLWSLGTDGAGPQLVAQGAAPYYGPIWRPDGQGITYRRDPTVLSSSSGAGDRGILGQTLGGGTPGEPNGLAVPPPETGFDVPLAWSPDGRYLAVRFFDGSSGRIVERLALLSPADGGRRTVETTGFGEFVGWRYGGQ